MPDDSRLRTLEAQRDDILRQLAQIGDMRKGSITETFRPCGKPSCVCGSAGHPGHGPYYAYTHKVVGKTRTIQLRAGPRLVRFEREVEAYKRFRALSGRLIEVNEAICEARPEPDRATDHAALKKTSRHSSRRRSPKKSTD
jgi:hypothetical protein